MSTCTDSVILRSCILIMVLNGAAIRCRPTDPCLVLTHKVSLNSIPPAFIHTKSTTKKNVISLIYLYSYKMVTQHPSSANLKRACEGSIYTSDRSTKCPNHLVNLQETVSKRSRTCPGSSKYPNHSQVRMPPAMDNSRAALIHLKNSIISLHSICKRKVIDRQKPCFDEKPTPKPSP